MTVFVIIQLDMHIYHGFALDIHVAACKGGSMTETLFGEYVNQVIRKKTGAIFNPPTLLLMDQATSHKVTVRTIAHCDVFLQNKS